MNEIAFSESFSYGRNFFIKDINSKKAVFSNVDMLEFKTFDDFVENYLKDDEIPFISTIDNIVIPVSTKEEMNMASSLVPENGTVIYIKTVDEDVLSGITETNEDGKIRLMVDLENVNPFINTLASMKDNGTVIEFLKNSTGIVRTRISYEDRFEIIYRLTDGFNTFPYFSSALAEWDFESFSDMKLNELDSVVYNLKLFRKNFIVGSGEKMTVDWADFGGSGATEYRFSLYSQNRTNHLYMDKGWVSFSSGMTVLPRINLNVFCSHDANEMPREEIDGFMCVLAERYGKRLPVFIDKEQNKRCTGFSGSLPYINRIVNSIIEKGDI